MLAERLPSILPPLSDRTALEATAIRSVASPGGSITQLVKIPPFQAPHHSSSMASIIGGGSGVARPGAASMAHGGVLFMDEAPEFDRRVLDALRQPLESRQVELHRTISSVTYPASFQLVLASNPCPCGWDDGSGRSCVCTSLQRRRYSSRLSGPLLDRVDIQVVVPRVTAGDLARTERGESSSEVGTRVRKAAQRQRERLAPLGVERNMELSGAMLKHAQLKLRGSSLRSLDQALDRGEITVRGYSRVLRLAWTLADLCDADRPGADEVDAAMNLRLQRERARNRT
ncbi:MAG: ATP-binding protein [Micrococcaceae bacterium]